MTVQVIRHMDADALAHRSAQRLVDAIVARQADGRVVQLCLTGGGIAMKMYARFARALSKANLNPELLELWWGDERFVPTASPDRLAGPTLATLAGRISFDPARIHPMAASDGTADAAAAAAIYARELGETCFDICLLGVGPDGHVASIFPGHPSSEPTTQTVIAVHDSPKPPPERLSLTIPTLSRSAEVWFIASGADKAKMAKAAIAGDDSIPAGQVRGRDETVWLVDRDAASELPYFECPL